MASLGDVNGDHAGDFALSAYSGTIAAGTARPVFIVSGALARGTVVAEEISASINRPLFTGYLSYQANSSFGFSMSSADLDGDGLGDLVASDASDGWVFIYSGTEIGAKLPAAIVSGANAADATTAVLARTLLGATGPLVYGVKDITGDADFTGAEAPLLSDFEQVLSGMEGSESLIQRLSKYTRGTWAGLICTRAWAHPVWASAFLPAKTTPPHWHAPRLGGAATPRPSRLFTTGRLPRRC
jgi:hypothetical protein